MIVVDQPQAVRNLLTSQNLWAPVEGQYFGWIREGQVVGGVGFYNHNPNSIEVVLSLLDHTVTRRFLFLILWYPFGQLKVKRLTLFISASNLKSINFVTKLGAYREATLPDGSADGDAYIYCLRPERCHIWSKLWADS